MTFRTITTEVDVDIDLSDFDDSELIEELHCRGIKITEIPDGFDLPKELLLLNSREDVKNLLLELIEANYDKSHWSRQVTIQKLDSILG